MTHRAGRQPGLEQSWLVQTQEGEWDEVGGREELLVSNAAAVVELYSLGKLIKMPHTYTPLACALSSWFPNGWAGCPGDKGRRLCGADVV